MSKPLFRMYARDRKARGNHTHICGSGNTLKTVKGYLNKCRKAEAENNRRLR